MSASPKVTRPVAGKTTPSASSSPSCIIRTEQNTRRVCKMLESWRRRSRHFDKGHSHHFDYIVAMARRVIGDFHLSEDDKTVHRFLSSLNFDIASAEMMIKNLQTLGYCPSQPLRYSEEQVDIVLKAGLPSGKMIIGSRVVSLEEGRRYYLNLCFPGCDHLEPITPGENCAAMDDEEDSTNFPLADIDIDTPRRQAQHALDSPAWDAAEFLPSPEEHIILQTSPIAVAERLEGGLYTPRNSLPTTLAIRRPRRRLRPATVPSLHNRRGGMRGIQRRLADLFSGESPRKT